MSLNKRQLNIDERASKGTPKKNPNLRGDVSKMGYRDDSPYRNEPYLDINTPSGIIDMSGTGIPLMANGRILPPYSGQHQFDSNVVREVPLAQYGGAPYGPQSWIVPQKAPVATGAPTVENARIMNAARNAASQAPSKNSVLDPFQYQGEPMVAAADALYVDRSHMNYMPEMIKPFSFNNYLMQQKLAKIDSTDEEIRKREYEKFDAPSEYMKNLDSYDAGEKGRTTESTIDTFKKGPQSDVERLQKELIAEGYNLGSTGIDGDFGPKTEAALRSRLEDKSLDTTVKDKYYKKYKPENETQVKKIQQQLLDEGYLVGGPEEVDGKFGDRTKAALDKFNAAKEPTSFFFTNIPKTLETTQCAKGMCQMLEQNDVMTEALGVKYKNAWDIQENMDKKKNSTSVYNIYDDARFKNVKTGEQLVETTKKVKAGSNTTADMYKTGDVIGIFWPSSSHHDEVLKSKTHNTHVGFVSDVVDGVPMITHNVHGTVKTEPYNNLYTGWIQRPNNDVIFDKNYKIETKDAQYGSMFLKNFEKKMEYAPGDFTDKKKKVITGTMNRAYTNAQNLPSMLGSDIDKKWLEAATFGITGVETAGGINEKESKSDYGYKKQLGYWYHDKKNEDVSLGLGKMKFSSLDDFSKQYFNVNTPEDLADNDKSVDLVSYNLIKHYDTFKDYSEQFPELELTEEDIRSMSILAHNRGDKKLLTLGRRGNKKGESNYYKDSEMKTYLDEVKGLRDISRIGHTQSDYTTTNYKHMPFGESLYNAFEDPAEAYVSKVKRYIDEVYGDGYSGGYGDSGQYVQQPVSNYVQQNTFEEGGEFEETEMDDEAIAYYRSLGYRIEEME